MSIYKNKKWFLLLLTVLVLFIVEIFLRTVSSHKFIRWNVMEYITDTILGYRYYPDTTFVFSNIAFSNTCTTNSHGFPGHEFPIKKQENYYRIMISGASDDTGFVSDGAYSYVQRLNDMFRKEGYPVEIINCSTDGDKRIVRNMEFIKNGSLEYEPDLILLHNELPLRHSMRFRETYRGAIVYMMSLDYKETIKSYIDYMQDNFQNWFRAYDRSYIFRYYMKIYFDTRRLYPEHKFVKFTENLFGFQNMMALLMYVRKDVRGHPPIPFDIHIYDADETVCPTIWNKPVESFSSLINKNTWIEVEVTEYLRKKMLQNDSLAGMLLNTQWSDNRAVSFTSENSDAPPELRITVNNKNTTLYPVETGTICDNNYEAGDSLIWLQNDKRDTTLRKTAFLKFNIGDLYQLDTGILRLYVSNDIFPDKIYTLTESADSLKSLQTFLENKNVKFALFDTYELPVKYNKSFSNRKINYISLDIPFKNEYSFGEVDGHSTQLGHQAIAEAFFKVLTEKLIPEKYLQKVSGRQNPVQVAEK